MRLKFYDGTEMEFDWGSTPLEIARLKFPDNANEFLGAVVNGKEWDMTRPIYEDDVYITFLTFNDIKGKEIFWHSTAHIMAHAVKDIFPDVKVAIGPAIEAGFYYDFDKEKPFTPEDLIKIEQRMREIIEENLPFERKDFKKNEAISFFKELGEVYKVELLEEITDETVSIYKVGSFDDLCRGPHLPSSGFIRSFKLLTVAGAYWHGDENLPMLQRIYGISFPTDKELDEFLKNREEAEKRDHRKLGKELDLYLFDEDVGAGLVIWTPRGAIIREIIENFWRQEHRKNGYELVYSPHVGREILWQKSGHLDYYKENMFPRMELETQGYYVKPMNCPFHIKIYKRKRYSYRELPIRWAELGTVYRYERSGVLHGLQRVRGFTQDDAHIICRPDQVESEIISVLKFSLHILRTFGFDSFEIRLSTKPEKAIGSSDMWELAQKALKRALELEKLEYTVDEGGGAFYGPKIDIDLKDALGRRFQCSTIQFDFNLPERFDMVYTGEDGSLQRPYMIHRALMGAIERFLATLVEHCAGDFPLWIAPIQAIILPVSDKFNEYAKQVYNELIANGIRVELDDSGERLNYKIRSAETKKIRYILVVGAKEKETSTVSVRRRGEGDIGTMSVQRLLEKTKLEIELKK